MLPLLPARRQLRLRPRRSPRRYYPPTTRSRLPFLFRCHTSDVDCAGRESLVEVALGGDFWDGRFWEGGDCVCAVVVE